MITWEELEPYSVEDWDQDGAKPLSRHLFTLAMIWVKDHKGTFDPEVNPCPDGSLDFVWRNDQWHLLLNYGNTLISWYGDNYNDGDRIKGSAEHFQFVTDLKEWLKRFDTNEKEKRTTP